MIRDKAGLIGWFETAPGVHIEEQGSKGGDDVPEEVQCCLPSRANHPRTWETR